MWLHNIDGVCPQGEKQIEGGEIRMMRRLKEENKLNLELLGIFI